VEEVDAFEAGDVDVPDEDDVVISHSD